MVMACSLIISLVSCSFDKPKTESKSKSIAKAISYGKPHTTIKTLSGLAFPGNNRAACCKGVPSRAKALAAISTK